MESNDSLSVVSGSSSVLLTPGRTRNIAQDMEALRLSRQDNPYIQHVMASRESLIESHVDDECVADDTILMSQEFGSSTLDLSEDPLTLKEVHEHMIRSPPPTSFWPQDKLSQRAASAFDFSHVAPPARHKESSPPRRARPSRSASPRADPARPLSLPSGEINIRNALSKKHPGGGGGGGGGTNERFSLLQNPRSLRRPPRPEDSVRLVECDK